MLKQPSLSNEAIITCVHDNFSLPITRVTFLPLGDARNAIYHVTADDGTAYFLKLCPPDFDEAAVTVPAYLYAQGIQQIIAPIPTTTHRLWMAGHDFSWILYPFFQGKTGFEMALSKEQWNRLGAGVRSVHQAKLTAESVERMPQEAYSPRWRNIVKAYHKEVDQKCYDDRTAASLATLWTTKRDEIQTLVQRAEQLALELQNRPVQRVVCHSDLHGGNVMVGADNKIAIVDWDEPILAPKERDLMFIGGGIGGIWNDDQEAGWFYEGYGPTEIDHVIAALEHAHNDYKHYSIFIALAKQINEHATVSFTNQRQENIFPWHFLIFPIWRYAV